MTEHKEQLAGMVDELVARVIKVAELTDKAFPGKNMGPGIKNCADVIKEHIAILSSTPVEQKTDLRTLAVKNCSTAFKHLNAINPNTMSKDADDIKIFEILNIHAREMFELLQSYPNQNNDDDDDVKQAPADILEVTCD